MQPIRLRPYIAQTIWGGRRLADEYCIDIGDAQNCAEAWVLSAIPQCGSVVQGGEYDGLTLEDLFSQHKILFGTALREAKSCPILVKLIDAMDDLSIQVHPRDGDAVLAEGESGKTECWYILDAAEGASLVLGFKEAIGKADFATAIAEQTLMKHLRKVPVKAGDFFFIPAGTLHAIGKGILLAEVQQSSATTYRIYDYGRLQNGLPRALHTAQSLAVTDCAPYDFAAYHKHAGASSVTQLVDCPYFSVALRHIETGDAVHVGESSFLHLLVLDGEAVLQTSNAAFQIQKGESYLLPAGLGKAAWIGSARILTTAV
ncbi:MAG: mannose-6-phosphate isomerase [Oscillospiraceae bacterium]|nr:mannose-6-phosphate isomerase [Oscillospiraceae bacterium]